jgi:toxin FitB
MIILDTNVLSELIKGEPETRVMQWLDEEPRISIWTSAISLFEIGHGIGIMPEGRRRAALSESLDRLVGDLLENRIAPFDSQAASRAADYSAKRKSLGRPVEFRDIMIAGIALSSGARLATRNIRDFEHSEITLVNPWAVPPM